VLSDHPYTDELVRRSHVSRRLCLGLMLAVIATALCVLVLGWGAQLPVVVRLHPDFPAMVPVTALVLLVSALALYLSLRFRARGGLGLAALFGLAVVIVHSVPALAAMFAAMFDRISGPATLPSDTFSLAAKACTLLLSASLAGLSLRARSLAPAIVTFASIGLALTMVPLLGYMFSAEALFSARVYTSMALHTALSFAALFIAILLLYPRLGWMGVLLSPGPGGVMARRLLPTIITGTLLICYLALIAVRADFFDVDFRLALLAAMNILVVTGAVLGFAGVANRSQAARLRAEESLTEKERALRESEVIAAHAQRVDALGRLVGGVAHDFNNLLTVILGNLELIQRTEDANERRTYLAEAIAASGQAAHLTRQLLAYGRKTLLSPEPVAVNRALGGMEGMMRRLLPETIELRLDTGSHIGDTQIDMAQFQQALLNLVINARDAMQQGGAVEIVTRARKLDEEDAAALSTDGALAPGAYVSVTVRDTGTGMEPDTLAQAVEPFFTTKRVGEGSGLGLSMVYGFCRQSGGALTLRSAPGAGTEATMLFPVIEGTERNGNGLPRLETVPPGDGGATVMIVEDGEAVARVLGRHVHDAGYALITADSGDAALEMLESGSKPDLVISDIVMPGVIQGHELAMILQEQYPDIRIVLMSGYQSENTRNRYPRIRDVEFLQKPIDRTTLLKAIRAALE